MTDAGAPTLRVALHCETGPGGALATTTTLLGALRSDIEVTVIGSQPDLLDELAASRPGAVTLVVPPVDSKLDAVAIGRHIAAVRRLRPDVLHVSCNNPWSSPYGLLAGVMTRTPTVAVVHGPAPAWRRRQQWLVRRLAPHVSVFVSVSSASSRATEQALALAPGSVRTIYNGVPLPPDLAPRPGPEEAVIGAVSRFSPEKALDVLIEAFAGVRHGRLVLIGDGDERPRLEALVEELGLVDRVCFAGWVTGPWTAQWALSALVVPSRSEGFGLVVVEAMLAGIPVVATDVGGLPELIEQDRTGLLVPADDPAALAGAITRVIDDRDQALQRAEAARLDARRRFSPAAMAAAYGALYDETARVRAR
jgi:glycosyltransferase involved in cell wall biosynthesis